jgi:uncharacterized membrane protein
MNRDVRPETWSGVLIPVALIFGLVALLSFDGAAPAPELTPVAHWLHAAIGYVAAAGEVAAALVIGVAVIRALVAYLARWRQSGEMQAETHDTIRLRLDRALILGLEFTVASDILATVVSPTRQELIDLGAIILLRSLLTHFLER